MLSWAPKEKDIADAVNKGHLVDKMVKATGLSKKDVKAVVDGVFEHITEHLTKGDEVQITGFGSFKVRERAARQGVNPSTGEKLNIAAYKAPAFKPSKSLKESVRG